MTETSMTPDDFGELFERRRRELLASDPACWSWEPPDGPVELYEWQQGRCAICGRADPLVEDHDHKTAMIRGDLCRSCNILEGMGHGGVFAKYRERNPAVICGVQERYWDEYKKAYAEPTPPAADYDPWKNNPMRNAGL